MDRYLATQGFIDDNHPKNISFGYFCSDEQSANQCAQLVLAGIKTATCSLKDGYEKANEPIPKIGNLHIVTDWSANPICIIQVIEVSEKAFNQVDERFAYLEGEGDRSLNYWRKAHRDFLSASVNYWI